MALNWPGLFAWSSKYHDGTAPSNFKQLSDEDREFLQKAMEDAFEQIEDPNKVFTEAIQQIKSAERTEESVYTALEIIDRLCDDPDVARNAEKLDGLQPLLEVASDMQGLVRVRTLEVLALVFSNNPNIQNAGVKRDGISRFLSLTRQAPVGSDEKSKAFRALVALVRQVPEHERALLQNEEAAALLHQLLDKREEARTREKVASFVTGLAVSGVLEEGLVAPISVALGPLLNDDDDDLTVQYRETVSACAFELARLAPASCKSALLDHVESRLKAISDSSAKKDGDEGAEKAALQGCLTSLSTV